MRICLKLPATLYIRCFPVAKLIKDEQPTFIMCTHSIRQNQLTLSYQCKQKIRNSESKNTVWSENKIRNFVWSTYRVHNQALAVRSIYYY